MEFKKTLRKFFKAKISSDLPEPQNGQILYAESENKLYIDTETSRNQINPQRDWEEQNSDSPSYIVNKPEIGTVASKDLAESMEETEKIPTARMVSDALSNASVWIKIMP